MAVFSALVEPIPPSVQVSGAETEDSAPRDDLSDPAGSAEVNSTETPPPGAEGSVTSEDGGLDQDVTGLERLLRTGQWRGQVSQAKVDQGTAD